MTFFTGIFFAGHLVFINIAEMSCILENKHSQRVRNIGGITCQAKKKKKT